MAAWPQIKLCPTWVVDVAATPNILIKWSTPADDECGEKNATTAMKQ